MHLCQSLVLLSNLLHIPLFPRCSLSRRSMWRHLSRLLSLVLQDLLSSKVLTCAGDTLNGVVRLHVSNPSTLKLCRLLKCRQCLLQLPVHLASIGRDDQRQLILRRALAQGRSSWMFLVLSRLHLLPLNTPYRSTITMNLTRPRSLLVQRLRDHLPRLVPVRRQTRLSFIVFL